MSITPDPILTQPFRPDTEPTRPLPNFRQDTERNRTFSVLLEDFHKQQDTLQQYQSFLLSSTLAQDQFRAVQSQIDRLSLTIELARARLMRFEEQVRFASLCEAHARAEAEGQQRLVQLRN